jgi:RNA polymerase sigma factor (sigma-70 family)
MALLIDAINDFELIRRMAEQNANFQAAREAWGHFYVRHHKYLLRVCGSLHKEVLGPSGVQDAVQDTFMKAFRGARTFRCEESCETEMQARKVRAWLTRILQNVVRDQFKGDALVSFVEDENLDQIAGPLEDASEESALPESERQVLVKSGLAALSEVEQIVLRATMFDWQGGRVNQRMPHSAMQNLSHQINKSPENIRQIRSRAMKKIEIYVIDRLHHEKIN